MQFEVMVIVETEERPESILNEIISALEFDHLSIVKALAVLLDGEQVAVYDKEQQ